EQPKVSERRAGLLVEGGRFHLCEDRRIRCVASVSCAHSLRARHWSSQGRLGRPERARCTRAPVRRRRPQRRFSISHGGRSQQGLGSMVERTRAATYDDLLHVIGLLEREHVEYALIGGYALALQGIVRLTEDIDILVEPTAENACRWV